MKGTIKSCGLIIYVGVKMVRVVEGRSSSIPSVHDFKMLTNGLAGNPTGLGKMFGSNGLSVVFGGMPNLIRIGSASTHGERSP
jgi:hypothetical protein